MANKVPSKDFEKALQVGRPPNILRLFPHSRALIVSGKAIDRAMITKGKAMTIASNGRNAFVDEKGELVKVVDQGMSEEMWAEMLNDARSKNLKAGDYKELNLPFENKLLGLPAHIRERMCQGIEDFVYELLVQVFNAQDRAPLAVEAICRAGSYDLGPKADRVEDPAAWTLEKIKERAKNLHPLKGPEGHFDD
jgi:hypothetical protein